MPRPFVDVGDGGWVGSVLLVGIFGSAALGLLGGPRPEENIGSEEPVRSEAAVAAAATLKR